MRTSLLSAIALLLLIIATANLLPSHAQKAARSATESGAPPLSNPLKVALLKWYQANTTTSFATGVDPFGVVFDGAHIWVGNNVDGTVQKFRTSDGALLGTFNVAAPVGLCFDGANVWITSYPVGDRPRTLRRPVPDDDVALGGTITKLRASDGKVLGTFNVGNGPWWPTFDGSSVWVPNAGDNTVTKVRASDGAILGTFDVGVSPMATAFDGAAIWVTNFTGTGKGSVTKLRASDGTVLGTFTVGAGPNGIAFDGANLWIANTRSGTVSKLRAADGMTLGTFNLSGETPSGVVFDGVNIWISGDSAVLVLRATDGKQLLALGQPGNSSSGIAFDGANVWVALSNAAGLAKF